MKRNIAVFALILTFFIIVNDLYFKIDQVELTNQVEKDEKSKKVDSSLSGLKIGDQAPPFTLFDANGKEVRLQDYKGKKVLLNFWATWCPPCREEMPSMEKVYQGNKKEGFEIIGINITFTEKRKEDVADFIHEYELTFPILKDEKGAVSNHYEVLAYPTSYFIDSNGIIRNKVLGAMKEDFIKREIQKLK